VIRNVALEVAGTLAAIHNAGVESQARLPHWPKKLMVSDIVVNDSSGFSVVTKAIPLPASATSHKMRRAACPLGSHVEDRPRAVQLLVRHQAVQLRSR